MKRIWTIILAAVMALSMVTPAFAAAPDHFNDVPANHWAYEQIERAYADGVIAGISGDAKNYTGVFGPDGTLTMAQFLTIMGRAFYPDEMQAEINAGHNNPWYQPAYNVAWNHGLFSKTSGTPAIEQKITRYDMASVMTNVMEDLGVQMPTKNELDAAQNRIGDFAQIPVMYQTSVKTVFALGVISGTDSKGTFAGANFMNRAQAAVVYGRMKDYVDGKGGSTEPTPTPDPEPADVFDFKFSDYSNAEKFANAVNAATPAYREGYLTNGKPITDANIKEFLEKVQQILPDGTTWNTDDKYNYYSPKFGGGGGCNSYAYLLSDWMFGEDAPLTHTKVVGDVSEVIKMGAVMRVTNYSTGYDHFSFVREIESTAYYTTSGNAGGHVTWNGLGFLKADGNEFNVYVRY